MRCEDGRVVRSKGKRHREGEVGNLKGKARGKRGRHGEGASSC